MGGQHSSDMPESDPAGSSAVLWDSRAESAKTTGEQFS